jgi:tetratricopeptide (TPR) repeat protein
MKCIKLLSIAAVLFGLNMTGSAQTLQEVAEARNKGTEFMAAGDLDKAIAEFERCVSLARQVGEDAEEHSLLVESALPGLYLRRANEINVTRDFPATLKALEAAVEAAERFNNPGVKETAEKTIPQIYLAMGVADFQAQRHQEAIANLDQAIARDPNLARAYFIRGASYQALRDEPKMEESYRLAIEKGTASGDAASAQSARVQLSRVYLNAGITARRASRWDDAIAAFLKTIELDNEAERADAYFALISSYNSKRSWDDAIATGEKALELDLNKNIDGIHFEVATAYAGKRNTAKACEYFRKVGEGNFKARAEHEITHTLKCN